MPWSETTPVKERCGFVAQVEEGFFSVAELCELYEISRKTGYKWVARFRDGDGLTDRSRRPRGGSHWTDGAIVERLLKHRAQHPAWGPKKLISRLRDIQPEVAWPAASTAGDILKRAGLVRARRPRHRLHPPAPTHLSRPIKPNDVWSADFKGQFKTRDGIYCYPLTVSDGASRYLLEVRALSSTDSAPVRRSFERLFRQYGLPDVIRTDNGTPFASTGLGRLSRLSIWWTRLGLRHERIAPAHPEQNGAHERMHRTLKAQTTRPPQANSQAQQLCFDRFRIEFNNERPHEALAQKTPSNLYRSSPRPYPARLPQPEYPGHFEIRRVGSNGCISWKSRRLALSHCLTGEHVALEEIDNGIWSLYFGPLLLARLDERTGQLHQGLLQ